MEDQGKRIVLFVVIAAAIFIGWQALFPAPKSPPKKPLATTPGQTPSLASPTWTGGAGSATPTPAVGPTTPAPAGGPTPAIAPAVEAPLPDEQTIELSTARFRLTFSNIGGTIARVHRLVDPTKSGLVDDDLFVAPMVGAGLAATSFINSTYPLSLRTAWNGEKVSETKVRYTTVVGGLSVVKEFELLPDDWMVRVTLDATVTGAANQQLAMSMFGHAPVVEGQEKWGKRPWGKCDMSGSVKSVSPGKVAVTPFVRQGQVRFFGAATPFFLFGLAPKPTGGADSYTCTVSPLGTIPNAVQIDLTYAMAQLAAGDTLHRELIGYLGPSYFDRLEHADKVAQWKTGFADTVDFGWFSVISKPMLWLLRSIFGFVGNWGIAIILLTVLVKLATLYWTNKSMKSMKAMAALKPEMEALQKKYGEDKQKIQQEQMALFKRHGVNPLAGCLPMLLQMPIWMGLYRMLSNAGELHQAVFIPGWLSDLTQRDPYYILPVALTGLMFLQSKMQPATTTDSAQQKMMMYGMPLMFGGMGLFFPAGLTVYITTNTLLGIAHTLYMKRGGTPAPVPAVAADDKASGDKASSGKASSGKASGGKASVIDAESTEVADGEDADDGDSDDAAPSADKKSPRHGQARRGQRKGKRR